MGFPLDYSFLISLPCSKQIQNSLKDCFFSPYSTPKLGFFILFFVIGL